MTRHIAMWSGPRNLSTAMMYSFAQRADCRVVDEPFYAAYLASTGLAHPMAEEVMASQPIDPFGVEQSLIAPMDVPVFYQKHMCQHMIEGMPRDWMAQVTNVFLIRHPARVIASFSQKIENITEQDIGFAAQAELYDECCARGENPVVIDSFDIRRDPETMLRKLCKALDIDFDPAMLSWPEGGNAADGVWARVWYGTVHRSTGFAGAEGDLPVLGGKRAALFHESIKHYDRLRLVRLTA